MRYTRLIYYMFGAWALNLKKSKKLTCSFIKKLSTSLALNQYPSCFSARAPLALAQEHNNKQSINNKQSAILNKEKEKLIIKRKRNLNAKAFLENRKIKNSLTELFLWTTLFCKLGVEDLFGKGLEKDSGNLLEEL